MTALALAGLTTLCAYLIGAIPFGYLIARWRGVDILQQGSGNIGATNVGRVLGPRYGVLVFLLDFAKGAVPVAVAGWITAQTSPEIRGFLERQSLPVAAGLAAFLGHLFPVYLRFRGGKGVATGAGVVAVLLPLPMLIALVTWAFVLCITRYVSLASLCAAVALCAARLGSTPDPFGGGAGVLSAFCLLAAGLVIVRHRTNLLRLLRGQEHRLRESRSAVRLTRIIHLLALSLWFGTLVFFTFFVGLSLFHTFQDLAETPAESRPIWYPLPRAFDHASGVPPLFDSAQAVRREQGTRTAGAAVAPLFKAYFLVQIVCGLLATTAALTWWRRAPGERPGRLGTVLLMIAVATVALGWLAERKVRALRMVRDRRVEMVLTGPDRSQEAFREAAAATHDFGRWHGISLLINFATLGLVTAALALTAVVSEPTKRSTTPAAPEIDKQL
jgi:acyl-phosphate glycerol 3-phosphate acyltransferase